MYILETENHAFIAGDEGNTPTLTTDISLARVFTKVSAAETFGKNSIPQKLKCQCGKISVRDITAVKVELGMDPLADMDVNINFEAQQVDNLPDSIKDIRNKLNEVRADIAGIVTKKAALVNQLSILDQKLVDLDHYIEFNDNNVVDSFKVLKMRQSLLRERREVKFNIITIASIIMGTKGLLEGTVDKSIAGLGGCHYSPRQLTKLFSGVKIKDYNISEDICNVQLTDGN